MTPRFALDTETTGLDFKHGTKPFFVTTCDDKGNQQYWEWDVDPLTREVDVPSDDKKEIEYLLKPWKVKRKVTKKTVAFQNAKFDIKALQTIGS